MPGRMFPHYRTARTWAHILRRGLSPPGAGRHQSFDLFVAHQAVDELLLKHRQQDLADEAPILPPGVVGPAGDIQAIFKPAPWRDRCASYSASPDTGITAIFIFGWTLPLTVILNLVFVPRFSNEGSAAAVLLGIIFWTIWLQHRRPAAKYPPFDLRPKDRISLSAGRANRPTFPASQGSAGRR